MIFQSAKLSLHKVVLAIFYFATESKGLSVITLSHKLNVQYKTAWGALYKFRESLDKAKDLILLQCEVIDGAYTSNYIRPKKTSFINALIGIKNTINVLINTCTLVFSQRIDNQAVMKGADRTIVALVKEENTNHILHSFNTECNQTARIMPMKTLYMTVLSFIITCVVSITLKNTAQSVSLKVNRFPASLSLERIANCLIINLFIFKWSSS